LTCGFTCLVTYLTELTAFPHIPLFNDIGVRASLAAATKENPMPDGGFDPWLPEDPDEPPNPRALLAYWKTANDSPTGQRRLVADRWRLWRLARDLAGALDGLISKSTKEPPQ
jgi:hypothetical protein